MESITQTGEISISGALKSIEKYVPASRPAANPIQFVLALSRAWKERGGTVAGKPRHSDRQLNELLRQQGTTVRSLTPKLAGKTKLKPDDVRALLRLFLSHWEYVGNSDGGGPFQSGADVDAYRPMLPDAEIEEVCRYIVDRISAAEIVSAEKTDFVASPFMAGEETAKLIASEFQESDALFIISSEQTMIVADPTSALIPFRNLVNKLFAIDRDDDRARILVWILDLGTLDFEDREARSRFLNVESLMCRLASLRIFKEQMAEARWNWLQSRTVIVLYDSRGARNQVAGFPAFAAHHFLFDAVPSSWVKSSEFRALYGSQLERVDERHYTIFFSRSLEDSADGANVDREYSLRYFAHAHSMPDGKDDHQVRGLELPSPGWDYEIAFETVYAAAAHTLGMTTHLTRLSIDATDAMGGLRRLGFSLLRLDEFLNLWSRSFSMAAD
jgi:hypothetical protein